MSASAGSAMGTRAHPTFFEKAAAWTSWLLAGAIFLTLGWMAMAPDDPLGAVSLLTRSGSVLMLVQAAGLALVTAALVTVIVGRRLPHAGTFAAGLGLAAASTRGGTTVALLLSHLDPSADSQPALAVRCAMEAAAWFSVMLIALGTSIAVGRWCHGTPPVSDASSHSLRDYRRPSNALQHFAITLVAGFFVYQILSQGWSARSIQHGQACFVVAASVGIAAYLAFRVAPVGSPIPSMLAAGCLAVIGYLWASFRSTPAGLPPIIPASPFLRVLPIQFVSVGVASAAATFWYLLPSLLEVDVSAVESDRE